MDERALAREFNPKKSLAQNFLTDETHLSAIAAAANLTAADTVLEIGPGLGVLTKYLAKEAGRVVAVELDNRLIQFLNDRFAAAPNVSIVHSDILKTDLSSLLANTDPPAEHDLLSRQPQAIQPLAYKVVANLPYYITSAVLRHLLEAAARPTVAILMVQKEVAERICAAPGKLSILAVSVQFYAQPQIVRVVPASAFYPRPKVDSAVLRLDILPAPVVEEIDPKQYFRVVKAGFSQKRKQLLNSMSAGLQLAKADAKEALEEAQIDPKRRAETLTLVEWGNLACILNKANIV